MRGSYCTHRVRALKQWLPVVVWAGFILSAANDSFSAKETGGLLGSIFGELPYVLHVLLRKSAHVVVYGILGALAYRAERKWLLAMMIVLAVASADEWMQSRALNRTGTPWDVLLDVVGAASVIFLLQRRGARRLN